MRYKLPCELVRDLFPSYIDGLTSEITNTMVEDHIAECRECKNILNVMRDPAAEPVESHDKEEIDFLKKTRKKSRKVIWASVITAVIVIAVVLSAKTFLIGSYVYSENIACEVSVDGNHLTLNGVIADSRLGISSVEYEEKDGVVTASFKAVKKSPLHRGEFESEYEADEDITQVCLDERIIWSQGEQVSAIASAVYNTRHAYVGDMPENGRTAIALNMAKYLGNFKNELQTSAEPYGWKLILEDELTASQQNKKENDMRSYAYILLAVIDNLGEVSYEYTMDGETYTVTVDTQEATKFAGQDIKECGQDVVTLQRLIEKTGLDTYAYVSDDSQWHTQDTIQVEIVNNTDANLSGVSLDYYLDETLYGTQNCENADSSTIERGDTMYFTFISDDFGGTDLDDKSDITFKALVYDEEGNTYEVTSAFHVPAEFGAIYSFSLSGNAADGYAIHP